MKRFCVLFLVLSAILISVSWAQTPRAGEGATAQLSLSGPAHAPAPALRLYDDFNTKFINPVKWSGTGVWGIIEGNPGCANPFTFECIREQHLGRLRLGVRTYGARDSDIGNQIDVLGLNFTNPNSVTSISTRIVVTGGQRTSCSANPWSEYQAALTGSFFNVGTGQKEDDVVPLVLVLPGETSSQVFACAFYFASGGMYEWNYLGPFNIGEEVIISLRWDQPNDRFVAGLRQPGAPATIAYLPYYFQDTTPPANPYKRIDVRAFAPNCVGEKTVTGMTALFDDVMVNASALP